MSLVLRSNMDLKTKNFIVGILLEEYAKNVNDTENVEFANTDFKMGYIKAVRCIQDYEINIK